VFVKKEIWLISNLQRFVDCQKNKKLTELGKSNPTFKVGQKKQTPTNTRIQKKDPINRFFFFFSKYSWFFEKEKNNNNKLSNQLCLKIQLPK